MAVSSNSTTLVALQGLRALAAALVVVTHLFDRMIRYSVLPDGWDHADLVGGIGVKLFFIISGFIMVRTTEDWFGKPGASTTFIKRRFQRVAPLYYLFTILYIFKTVAVDDRAASEWNALLSILFIPYRNAVGLMQPYYELGWTLNYEMYFYVIFGICMTLARVPGIIACFAVILFICGLNPVLHAGDNGFFWEIFTYYSEPIALFFLFGMFIAIVTAMAREYSARLNSSACLFLGVTMVVISIIVLDHPIEVAICCSGAVLFAALEKPGSPSGLPATFINLLGNSSYSVYLTHSFVLGPLFAVARKFNLLSSPQLLGVIGSAIAACLGVGALVHLFIEKPMLGFLRSRRWRMKAAEV